MNRCINTEPIEIQLLSPVLENLPNPLDNTPPPPSSPHLFPSLSSLSPSSYLPPSSTPLPNNTLLQRNISPDIPPNTSPPLPHVDADTNADTDDDKKRWSPAEIKTVLEWMQITKNLEKYKKKPKIQTYKELTILIPGKTEKQVKNKLELLEKKYKYAKAQTKQTGWGANDGETIKS
jgi:hypothetical protein